MINKSRLDAIRARLDNHKNKLYVDPFVKQLYYYVDNTKWAYPVEPQFDQATIDFITHAKQDISDLLEWVDEAIENMGEDY